MKGRAVVAIALEPGGGQVRIRPIGFLGQDRFSEYRRSIDGAEYDRERRTNIASVDRLPGILTRLRDASFDVNLESDAKKALQRYSAAQMFDLQRVRERIAEIDREIRERTGERLYPFQRTGAEWLTLKKSALLADEMGTGKTLQIITAIPTNTPVLVVVPARLKGVWTGEVSKWRPFLRTIVLRGRDSFRWPKPGEMVITNFDVLPEIHDAKGVSGRSCKGLLPAEPCEGCAKDVSFSEGKIRTRVLAGKHEQGCTGLQKPRPCPGCHPILAEAPEGIVLVVDEAHFLKSPSAARTQKFRGLVRAVKTKKGCVWGSTGTPLENHPMDLWNVYRSIGIEREAFGTFEGFARLFRGSPNYVKGKAVGHTWPKLETEDSERIKPHLQRVSLRRLRKEVLPELPVKRYAEIEVEIDRKTLARCDALVKEMGGIDRLVELIEKSKGETAGLKGLSTLRMALATAKIPAMLDVVASYEAQDEPLVVFSVHRAPIEKLAQRPGWAAIIGGSNADASDIQRKFQEGELRGVAMTLSGGTGLTLTRACHLVRVDHDYRPSVDDQVEDRLLRISQRRGVLILDLVADHPLERRVMAIHRKKRGFIAASVDAARATEDAPTEIDEEVKRIQEQAANGGAIRRVATSAEETALIEELHVVRFESRGDEQLAARLAEEAATIGLSEAQWKLATKIAARGVRHKASGVRSEEEGVRHQASGGRPDEKTDGLQSTADSPDEKAQSSEPTAQGSTQSSEPTAQGSTQGSTQSSALKAQGST
jgi:SNF2 family DNA or RNA helicase